MSALALALPILLDIAKKVGAPFVRKILEEEIGGTAGKLGGAVIDAIAGKADVSPTALPDVPPTVLEKAVLAVEADAPELVLAWNEQQRMANELQLAEMQQSESTWTWAWRPAGMYLLGFFWLLYVLVYPLLNLFLRLFGATAELQTMVDVATLLAVSGGFISLYMGGHTILKGIEKWKARDQ
jgi:hypothetical protein